MQIFDSPQFYLKLERYVAGTGNVAPNVTWRNSHAANIEAILKSGQVLTVKISSVPGWRASVGGRRVPIVRDALDFTTIKPGCNGACEINLEWSSPGPWLDYRNDIGDSNFPVSSKDSRLRTRVWRQLMIASKGSR